jgi:hypothetical protein
MTCLASPQQVTPTATLTFTVQTFASGGPPTAYNNRAPLWPRGLTPILSGSALAALVFFVLPWRSRRIFTDRMRGVLIFALLLAGLGGAGIGCSSSVTNVPLNTGTPLGVATLTITGTAYVNNTVVSHRVYLTVNVVPPS